MRDFCQSMHLYIYTWLYIVGYILYIQFINSLYSAYVYLFILCFIHHVTMYNVYNIYLQFDCLMGCWILLDSCVLLWSNSTRLWGTCFRNKRFWALPLRRGECHSSTIIKACICPKKTQNAGLVSILTLLHAFGTNWPNHSKADV